MSGNSGCFELWAIVPELILASLSLMLVPVAGWARRSWQQLPMILGTLGLVAVMILTARMLTWQPTAVFCDTYAVDGLGTVFKLLLELSALITLLATATYFHGHPQVAQAPVAILLSTLGGMGLASSLDLGLIVLFLQMLSLASYLLVSLVRSDQQANEATIKYFIYAAVALAVMAYGLTFLYGLSGSLELRTIGDALRSADRVWVAVALGLVLIGYAFETTLVPLHVWAPDTYQGTTAPIAGFLSVVPKIAGFAGLLRFVMLALPDGLMQWPTLAAVLAAVTMTFGNLVALRQARLNRLLAYSSIAQAGYVLMAVAVADRIAVALGATGYYLAAYLFMNLGAFAVVAQLERAGGSDQLAALRGLGRRAPGAAAVLALSCLSLAGIPPLAGFAGKVVVFAVTLEGGLTWLAVMGAMNMAIALYYYVAIVAAIYLRAPDGEAPVVVRGAGSLLAMSLSLTGTFVLGILPGLGLTLTQLIASLV